MPEKLWIVVAENIKRGEFAADEVDLILRLHKLIGNRQVKKKQI